MTDYYKDDEHAYKPPDPYGPRFDSTDVRVLREERGCSMMEAKNILIRQQILEDLRKGRNGLEVAVLYDILEYIMANANIRF